MLLPAVIDEVRRRVGQRLEGGLAPSPWLLAAERAWVVGTERSLSRPLAIPTGARVVAVGSATLGGAGKTPVAIAIARRLAALGEPVAIISHAYRASPGAARRVLAHDEVRAVGDDALHVARVLAPNGVPVYVAPRRAEAMAAARSAGARALVIDGGLSIIAGPGCAQVLVLDAPRPWGSGACPPLGDLRLPRARLLAMATHLVVIGPAPPGDLQADPRATLATSTLHGAVDARGRHYPLAELRRMRVGLLLGIAHPERVERSLREEGITPAHRLDFADHATFGGISRRALPKVDAWLTTGRCATKLPARLGSAPVLALAHSIALDEGLNLGETGR